MVGCKKFYPQKPIPTIDVIQMAMNPIVEKNNKFMATNEKTSDKNKHILSEIVMPMDSKKTVLGW